MLQVNYSKKETKKPCVLYKKLTWDAKIQIYWVRKKEREFVNYEYQIKLHWLY